MMNVPSALGWFGFRQTLSGDGAITVSGEVASVSSGAGTGSAKLERTLKLSPGERARVSVFARRISGSDSTSGGLALDFPSVGSLDNRVRVLSEEWQEYTVEYAAPFNVDDDDYLNIAIGVFTSDGGEVEFAYPRIALDNTAFGAPRLHSYGLIVVTSGTPELSTNFVHFGIKGLSYDAGTMILTVQLEPGIDTSGRRASPLFFCQTTLDNPADIVAKPGQFDRATGELFIKFLDSNAGAYIDISGITTYIALQGIL